MAERLVAEASSVEGLAQISVGDLAPGSRGRIEIHGFGIGVAADLAGAENVFRNSFAAKGLQVEDVYGEGWDRAYIQWSVPASTAQMHMAHMSLIPFLLVIGAIALALAALGWAVDRIRVLLEAPGGWIPLAALLVGGVVILAFVMRGKKT